jgi:hypothetical protein
VKRAFGNVTLTAKRAVVVEKANEIIAEYQTQGLRLTLRQLYYQFVSRGYIANNLREYKNLGSAINVGRLAGAIDWSAIEDRTRNLSRLPSWSSPEDIVSACASQYREDAWGDQRCHVEVWVEKEALSGVIGQIADELRAPWFACRGYVSQSEMFEAGFYRFRDALQRGREVHVVHLGMIPPGST